MINADGTPGATATTVAFGLTGNQLPTVSGSEIPKETKISLGVTIAVGATDRDRLADLLAVALIEPGELWFMLTSNGWQPWSGQLADLRGYGSVGLQATVNTNLVAQTQLPPADYSVFCGYRLTSGQLVYSPNPLRFTVR